MIKAETRDRVARIELARPEKKNAITAEMYLMLADAEAKEAMSAFLEKRKLDFSRF